MRFEEKIAEGRVKRFAVIFGKRGFRAAALEGWRLGVRDVFFFSDWRTEKFGVTLQYLDYEAFDFGELERAMNPPWPRGVSSGGWNLNKWPAEKVIRLEAERKMLGEELDRKLFDQRLCVELELPYRLGPLCFLQATSANDPTSTRWEIREWPDMWMAQLRSVADRSGTQVVFVPDDRSAWAITTVDPDGLRILDSKQEVKVMEAMDWVKDAIHCVAPGNGRVKMFCVCDLEKEQVVWGRGER